MALPPVLQNLRVPVIGSPLFIISNPDLVIAQCKAGVVGSFPALNARPGPVLDEWLDKITTELAEWDEKNPDRKSAPYAVNQIVHKTNNRLDHDVEACVRWKVPVVITSLGARQEVNDAIHSYGGIVLHDIINIVFAHKALEKGADGLIAVASGAGGHAGTLSPFALIQEIRQFFDGPLALSGSIATGNAVAAAQAMGADLGYIGSAFISCHEANAVEGYKDMIVDSKAGDIVYSNLFTGVHGNYLAPSIAKAGMDVNNLPESDPSAMNFGSGGNQEAKAWKDIWGCGQGIGAIQTRMSTADYVDQLEREYNGARDALAKRQAYAAPKAAVTAG
ncbi:MAG: nitronate monooxygenase family protein [Alphaproteobacteria bacterium]|nr:nitronate monooxygenase family protein [Alphaproteobacteria bacterium]